MLEVGEVKAFVFAVRGTFRVFEARHQDGNVTEGAAEKFCTWDACDETGNRVKTGIYKVFASQGETSTTGEPLTTIAVIK